MVSEREWSIRKLRSEEEISLFRGSSKPKFSETVQYLDKQAELLGQEFDFQLQGYRKVDLPEIMIPAVRGSSSSSDFGTLEKFWDILGLQ